jgi:sigma-E factor negative regulatory protein RseC
VIEETARVVALEGDVALVETQRSSACGSCTVGSGCGTALIGRFFGHRAVRTRARNRAGARVGQQVVLGLDETAMLKGALALYLVPLLGLLAGAILGRELAEAWQLTLVEPLATLMAFGGLFGGLAWARRFGCGAARDGRYQAVVLRTLEGVAVAVNEIHRAGSHALTRAPRAQSRDKSFGSTQNRGG